MYVSQKNKTGIKSIACKLCLNIYENAYKLCRKGTTSIEAIKPLQEDEQRRGNSGR